MLPISQLSVTCFAVSYFMHIETLMSKTVSRGHVQCARWEKWWKATFSMMAEVATRVSWIFCNISGFCVLEWPWFPKPQSALQLGSPESLLAIVFTLIKSVAVIPISKRSSVNVSSDFSFSCTRDFLVVMYVFKRNQYVSGKDRFNSFWHVHYINHLVHFIHLYIYINPFLYIKIFNIFIY